MDLEIFRILNNTKNMANKCWDMGIVEKAFMPVQVIYFSIMKVSSK